MIWLPLLVVSLASLAEAFTKHEPNCTAPPEQTNFFSSAETRGTLDILWSCLFTIIACTWSVQHLNVPEQRNGRDPGILGDIKWGLRGALKSAKWMVITVLAPEVLLAQNAQELSDAKYFLKELQEFAAQDGVPWTMTHTLFANMGGFIIRPNGIEQLGCPTASKQGTLEALKQLERFHRSRRTRRSKPAGETCGLLQDSGDLSLENPKIKVVMDIVRHEWPERLAAQDQSAVLHLRINDILKLRILGILPKLPYITEEAINDKSKSDTFGKTVAMGQIFWMLVQIVARAYQRLAISQLEIAVAAFSACAIVIYALNWKKPKGVGVPLTLLQYTGSIPDEIWLQFGIQTRSFLDVSGSFSDRDQFQAKQGSSIRNVSNLGYAEGFDLIGGSVGSVVFGAIHLAAWNFEFPTTIEGTIWRAASVYCTCFFVAFLLCGVVKALLEEYVLEGWDFVNLPIAILLVIFFLAYVLARLALIVETFRTLFFLPPSAYVATWASNVPHIA